MVKLLMAESDGPMFDTVPPWQGFAGAAIVIPLYLAFSYLVDEGTAWVAAMSAISIGASVRISWPLRNRSWFWAAIVVITLLHVALIFVPIWRVDGYPSIMLWPYAIADIGIILGVVSILNARLSANRRQT